MAEPVVAKKKYTYQDYLKTPDGERYELIQGELVRLPSPNTAHLYENDWKPVVRYDTAHGYAHKDLLGPDGTQEKIFMGIADFNEALTLASKDIDENRVRYKERFFRRLKR